MNLNNFRWGWILIFLGVLSFLPWLGGESISFSALWKSDGPFEIDHTILWNLRIPRLLFVIGVGGSLALIG
ncbi:MAG: iron chelate uptake ABC transporter family permease subunit, partial [Deltaproteobacteria bacterium]